MYTRVGAIPFSRGSSQPRDWTQVFCIPGRFFAIWATREAHVGGSITNFIYLSLNFLLNVILFIWLCCSSLLHELFSSCRERAATLLLHCMSFSFRWPLLLWVSLVAQTVKNLLATQETQVHTWVWKIPWRNKWQPIAVFSPRESHGQKSLAGYSPWGRKELDTTATNTLAVEHRI